MRRVGERLGVWDGGGGGAKAAPTLLGPIGVVRPKASTLALWWLKFGPAEGRRGGGGGEAWAREWGQSSPASSGPVDDHACREGRGGGGGYARVPPGAAK